MSELGRLRKKKDCSKFKAWGRPGLHSEFQVSLKSLSKTLKKKSGGGMEIVQQLRALGILRAHSIPSSWAPVTPASGEQVPLMVFEGIYTHKHINKNILKTAHL